ncbi:MAG: glycosyltransferase [Vicinamibacteria bacterium]|nr:glycosyltransferase [Vicinamibacteria bacterium]
MKILLLAPDVPIPSSNGGRRRILAWIDALAGFAEVRVLAIGDPGSADARAARVQLAERGIVFEAHRPTPDDARMRKDAPAALFHYWSSPLLAALHRHMREWRPDGIHVEEIVMTPYVENVAVPYVLSRQKVEWQYWESVAARFGELRSASLAEAEKFHALEMQLRPGALVVAGESDLAAIAPFYRNVPRHVIPIGIGDEYRRPAERTTAVQYVLMYGAADYPPNIEAQDFYFREVWPQLRQAAPALDTWVVGSGRPAVRSGRIPAYDGRIRWLGYVPDVTSVLTGPGVLAAPLHIGGGGRTKIIEALACGLPVVGTSVAVDNLALAPGRDYLHAESGADFTAAILLLVQSPKLAGDLSAAGAARAEAWRWSALRPRIEALYRDVFLAPAMAQSQEAFDAASDAAGLNATVRASSSEGGNPDQCGNRGRVRRVMSTMARLMMRPVAVYGQCIADRLWPPSNRFRHMAWRVAHNMARWL